MAKYEADLKCNLLFAIWLRFESFTRYSLLITRYRCGQILAMSAISPSRFSAFYFLPFLQSPISIKNTIKNAHGKERSISHRPSAIHHPSSALFRF